VNDAMAGYRFLLSQSVAPEKIAIAGESAGGGLAIATLVSLRDAGVALPACAWCSSPWVDLEMTGGSMTTKAAVDPLISKAYLIELVGAWGLLKRRRSP
jgi:epsilon-lactone hydrolase